jgi:pseudaminic acid synthase
MEKTKKVRPMDTMSIEIAGRRISADCPPYVIAEVSANHNGSLETALRMMKAAKNAGADAVKLQTYKPDTITLDCDAPEFRIEGGLWDGRTLYDLYEEAHMPWDWHAPLFARARELGITIFSSPFDSTAVDLLESLDAPAYKIASFEAVDTPLIRYAALTGKPLIISTGMASDAEIQDAIDAARAGGCEQLAILHCVSGYPAPAGDYNLRTLPDMTKRFGVMTGLSDHTLDNTTAIAAVALGATIIEKHFTLDRSGGGPDDSFSLEPGELAALCTSARTAWDAMGRIDYGKKPSELGNIKLRRSLYFVRDIAKGEMIGPNDVRSVRPGYGLPPSMYDKVINQPAQREVARNTPVTADMCSVGQSAAEFAEETP